MKAGRLTGFEYSLARRSRTMYALEDISDLLLFRKIRELIIRSLVRIFLVNSDKLIIFIILLSR